MNLKRAHESYTLNISHIHAHIERIHWEHWHLNAKKYTESGHLYQFCVMYTKWPRHHLQTPDVMHIYKYISRCEIVGQLQ